MFEAGITSDLSIEEIVLKLKKLVRFQKMGLQKMRVLGQTMLNHYARLKKERERRV